MAPIGSTNLNDGASRIRPEYLRRSQRIASSSQTPLRQEIKARGSNSSSPTRTRQAKPIQPQVTYHQAPPIVQSNFFAQMREDTPVIRNQRLHSEDEDNIFQSTRIPQQQPVVEESSFSMPPQNLMLLETPGRIRTLIDRLTPSALSKRILSNGIPPEPSSPLLSIPTVRANKVRFVDGAEQTEGNSSEENYFFSFFLYLLLLIPRFVWNNIQTIWIVAYYLLIYPFQKTAKILFTKENVTKTPRGRNIIREASVNWTVLGISIFVFIVGFLLNVNYFHESFKEKDATTKTAQQPSIPAKPVEPPKEDPRKEELEKVISTMNERVMTLEFQINQQQNRKLEDSLNAKFKTHLQEMTSLKDQIIWLKKEHSNIQSLIEKTALSIPSISPDQSSSAVNFEVISSMVSNLVQERTRELQDQLAETITEIENQKQENEQKSNRTNYRTNWAIRSLGTRIYKLGTSSVYKKNKGWKRMLESAGRPTIIQSASPITEPGDAWCFSGSTGQVTLAFVAPLLLEAVRIQNPFDHKPAKVKVYGRTTAFSQNDYLLGSFEFTQDVVELLKNNNEAFKYLRLVFESDKEFIKTCIYRVAIYGKEV